MFTLVRNFYYQSIYPLDPDSLWLLHSLRVVVMACVGLLLARYVPLPQINWFALVLVFAVLLKPLLGGDCRTRKRNLLIYGVLQAVSVFVFSLSSGSFWAFMPAVFLTVWGLFYLRRWGTPYIPITMISVALAAIASNQPTDIINGLWRVLAIICAIAVTYGYVFYLWPDNFRRAVRKHLVSLTRDLATYAAWMMRDVVRGGQYSSRYSELRQQAFAKYKTLQNLWQQQAQLPRYLRCRREFQQIMRYQRMTYEVTVMLENCLRRLPDDQRVKDFALLLEAISQDVIVLFIALQNTLDGKPMHANAANLHRHITQLSDNARQDWQQRDIHRDWLNLIATLGYFQRAVDQLIETTERVMQ